MDTGREGVFMKQTVLTDGVPQCIVGHSAMMAAARAAAAPYHVALAGMAVRGVGVNDCIASGIAAAAEAIAAYSAATGRAAPAPAFARESAALLRQAEGAAQQGAGSRLCDTLCRAAAAVAAVGAAAGAGTIAGVVAQVLCIRWGYR